MSSKYYEKKNHIYTRDNSLLIDHYRENAHISHIILNSLNKVKTIFRNVYISSITRQCQSSMKGNVKNGNK